MAGRAGARVAEHDGCSAVERMLTGVLPRLRASAFLTSRGPWRTGEVGGASAARSHSGPAHTTHRHVKARGCGAGRCFVAARACSVSTRSLSGGVCSFVALQSTHSMRRTRSAAAADASTGGGAPCSLPASTSAVEPASATASRPPGQRSGRTAKPRGLIQNPKADNAQLGVGQKRSRAQAEPKPMPAAEATPRGK
eukprot:364588-Chlamydomonas_euryale.AAC.19